jgi:uncharacterized protein (TIGR03435 family)
MNRVTLIVPINLLTVLIYAQAVAPQPAFEVATIKPSDGNQPGQAIGINVSGTLTAHNVTVRKLIMEAYDLREVQVAGGPPWVDSDRFDITAKPPAQAGNEVKMQESMD